MQHVVEVDGMAWTGMDRMVRSAPGGGAAIFRAIGMPMELIGRSGVRQPLHRYLAFFEQSAAVLGDPDFGFRYGSRTRAERSGLPGHLMLNCATFEAAICDLTWSLPLLVGGMPAKLFKGRGRTALIWSVTEHEGAATQFRYHAAAYFVCMLRSYRGRRWRPLRMSSTMLEPVSAEQYRKFLGCPVEFSMPVDAIELDPSDLPARRAGADPHLHALLSSYATEQFARMALAPAGLEQSVRLGLRDGFANGGANLAQASRHLGTSTRSLQRALAEIGQSFADLRDSERFGLAQRLLRSTELSISEIAYRLGYAEAASFSNAFRRRFDMSPREARAKRRDTIRDLVPSITVAL